MRVLAFFDALVVLCAGALRVVLCRCAVDQCAECVSFYLLLSLCSLLSSAPQFSCSARREGCAYFFLDHSSSRATRFVGGSPQYHGVCLSTSRGNDVKVSSIVDVERFANDLLVFCVCNSAHR